MQQFAELMASQALKDCGQQEALRSTREGSGHKAAGLKGAPARHHLHGNKPPPAYNLLPRPDQREPSREEARSCSCGQPNQQHVRSCPGYPLPPSFASFLSLKPRETPPSSRTKAPKPDRNCLPKDLGAGSVDPGLGLALGMSLEGSPHDPDCPYDPDTGQQQLPKQPGQEPAVRDIPHRGPSLPCLCFQTCAQFLCQAQAPPLSDSGPQPADSGPFPCFSCQRSFPTCAQLLRHQQSHGLQEGASQHLCMHCAAAFPRPALLLQHQRERHASKPGGFLCAECGRAFNSHSNLRIHLNVHTGARPYACADCGKSFSQSGALRVHRRIHTGERPYVCAYCARGFSNLAGLRAHERTHTGEKPYPCPQCGKCFTQSGALKIHTRIHTGERPFVCGHCGKAFSSHSGIRFHHRTVHGAMPKVSITMGLNPGVSLAAVAAATGSGAGPGSDSDVSSPASLYSGANACSSLDPKSPGLDAASSSSSFLGPASPPASTVDLRTGGGKSAAAKPGLDPAVSGLDLSCGGPTGREQRARPYEGAGRGGGGARRGGLHRNPEQQRGRAGAMREKEARERGGTGELAH